MKSTRICAAASVAASLAAALVVMGPAHAQIRQQSVLAPRSLTELREHDSRIERMIRQGDLRRRVLRADRQLPGRTVERTEQHHRGVRVFGGEVSRQIAGGQTISAFGTLYEGIEIDTSPTVPEAEARAMIEAQTGQRLGPGRGGELVILPIEGGGYALTWKLRVAMPGDVREYFVDARNGEIRFEYSDLQTQLPPIGRGTGVNGDSKKISVLSGLGGFITHDTSRPPSIRTYDMKGNPFRVDNVLNGFVSLNDTDFASDADNAWSDSAVVDAHVFSGLTYDYYYKRFNRRGINDNNLTMRTHGAPCEAQLISRSTSTSFPSSSRTRSMRERLHGVRGWLACRLHRERPLVELHVGRARHRRARDHARRDGFHVRSDLPQ